VVQVYSRGEPSWAGHVTPGAREGHAVILSPSGAESGDSGHTDAGRDGAATNRDRRGSRQLCGLSGRDELLAEPVLEGHQAGLEPARHQQHFLVLDLTHSTGPMQAGKVNTPAR